jgi:hypothetical protein
LEVAKLFKAVGGSICARDRPYLAQLFEEWGGLGWFRRDNWLSSAPLKDWFGITCEKGASGRVSKLYLGHNGLEGSFTAQRHGSEEDGGENNGLGGLVKLTKLR